jgi:hypothetical protein
MCDKPRVAAGVPPAQAQKWFGVHSACKIKSDNLEYKELTRAA